MITVEAVSVDQKFLEEFITHLQLGSYVALEIPQDDKTLRKFIIQKVTT